MKKSVFDMTEDERRSFIGKLVNVTINNEDKDKKIVTGRLIGFGQGGDFTILDRTDGMLYYCWPMLEVEEIQ